MITRSIKMALKKIHEACEERSRCDGCPYSVNGSCFFDGMLPEYWDFDRLKGEEE